ncbi:TetR/AcrR family transcriptional regulator [Streptomyces montanisoli]|uniref:TetR/AcrR family transcriptional regulator C-terminal domain-containing protein n=1 Tax=Streptomyces montanisoli TaxID=2798581 RepID=A0A940M5N3_9ACTN|nr:TetR/AcrR family transcriptional regulator [Streptomyces montanisoli]MBP0456584.1 TetR/AcrR family transcriptional regulator C-terminal domain-containing protein [Streptomyces montanisoli]
MTGRPARGTARRAEPLSATGIIRCARELVERDGLEALSMRRLADRLDTQAASLYRHVQNKEELVDLVADSLFGDFESALEYSADEDWRATLVRVATSYRSFLLARRDAERVLAGRFVVGQNLVRLIEPVLEALRAAGLGPRDAAYSLYLVIVHVQGFVLHEKAPLSASHAVGEGRLSALTSIRAFLEEFPEEDFPRVHESAPYLAEPGLDGRFHYGLDVLLDGLALRIGVRGAD